MNPAAATERTTSKRRRRIGQVFAEMHYELRTEGDAPWKAAGSVWLGTVIGCLPVYGAHLLLCAVLGRLLRLSRIKAYRERERRR